ncbi:hypothetical protein ACQBAU_05460 [Propionibacteriaceae bacterium Y2011]
MALLALLALAPRSRRRTLGGLLARRLPVRRLPARRLLVRRLLTPRLPARRLLVRRLLTRRRPAGRLAVRGLLAGSGSTLGRMLALCRPGCQRRPIAPRSGVLRRGRTVGAGGRATRSRAT